VTRKFVRIGAMDESVSVGGMGISFKEARYEWKI